MHLVSRSKPLFLVTDPFIDAKVFPYFHKAVKGEMHLPEKSPHRPGSIFKSGP